MALVWFLLQIVGFGLLASHYASEGRVAIAAGFYGLSLGATVLAVMYARAGQGGIGGTMAATDIAVSVKDVRNMVAVIDALTRVYALLKEHEDPVHAGRYECQSPDVCIGLALEIIESGLAAVGAD